MWWIILIIFLLVLIAIFNSPFGRIAVAVGVIAIGCVLISWITGVAFLITIAKACAVLIVVLIVAQILMLMFGF